MLRRIILAEAMICILMAGCVFAGEPGQFDAAKAKEDGRAIAEKVDETNRPKQDLSINAVMNLMSGGSKTDTRQLVIRQKNYGATDRYALRFMDSTKRGVTFMTIENQGADNDQYLYIPSLGRSRKIAVNDRQNAFEDTDFSNEDLGGRKIDDYNYERKADVAFSGTDCYKVEAVSKDASAKYPKQISWIDKNSFVPLQVKFFGKEGTLERVLVAGDIKNVKGINVPFKTAAKDLRANHSTLIEVSDVKVDSGINSADFDKEKMGETWK
ncbi:outer membrane lipoprotein-sorting protein [Desulforegula conservatrix]|uniref:outer membrane lipoprotein-sorting protein n=1 Tax=Desulforegula conservatrix TaxID=153026 RepID=UPI0009FD9C8C|nr:outer membrane lipoprotein-sorting protein [Desulforegula conservatrix]